MKKLLFISLVVFIASCSTTKTTVTEQKSNTSVKELVVPNDKSVIYVVRPSVIGAIIPFKFYVNDSLIGSTTGNKYLYILTEPGEHIFRSEAENKVELKIRVEAGKAYFIEQKPKMGLIMARNQLEQLSEIDGINKLAKCKLSTKFTPPDY